MVKSTWNCRRTVVAIVAAVCVVATGCSATAGEISVDTACEEYLSRSSEERQDAAIRISSEVDGVSSPGNPMWALSLDSACGSNPSMTIGEYFSNGTE